MIRRWLEKKGLIAPSQERRESEERAVFRPPIRGLGVYIILGTLGGIFIGLLFGVPVLWGALFGAASTGIVLSSQHGSRMQVVADGKGLTVQGVEGGLRATWSQLRLGFGMSPRADGSLQRYAIVADMAGRSFAFAEQLGQLPCRPVLGADGKPVEVLDLQDAALLLALIVQRVPAWHVLPEPLLSPTPAPDTTSNGAEPAPAIAQHVTRTRVGIIALLLKLGGGALKAASTTQFGWAVASMAAYGLLFSWKFAIAIMLQLFVHEYGHVHAMLRTGMKVRGMYFIPILGAVAVTEDAFDSRRQQAYVALSGPIWGSALAVGAAALYYATRDPLFAVVAAWWAFINLFNLLPIAPLDGGRVMQAFAYSFSSWFGTIATILGLAIAVAFAVSFGWSLIYLIATLGALELLSETQARAGARALRLLPERNRFGVTHFVYLRAVLGPPLGSPTEGLFLRNLERQQRASRGLPMRPREIAAWGLAYVGLVAALVALLLLMRSAAPEAAAAVGIFH